MSGLSSYQFGQAEQLASPNEQLQTSKQIQPSYSFGQAAPQPQTPNQNLPSTVPTDNSQQQISVSQPSGQSSVGQNQAGLKPQANTAFQRPSNIVHGLNQGAQQTPQLQRQVFEQPLTQMRSPNQAIPQNLPQTFMKDRRSQSVVAQYLRRNSTVL